MRPHSSSNAEEELGLSEKFLTFWGTVTVAIWIAIGVSLQSYAPLMFTVQFVALFCLRFSLYRRRHWQHYCLDLCYLGNILLIIYLWVLPKNPEFFAVVYSLCHGPLLFGAIAFGNKLVLHSLDKLTSVFIHIIPPCLCYLIHWFPHLTHSLFGCGAIFETCTSSPFSPDSPMTASPRCQSLYWSPIWFFLVPWLVTASHTVAYNCWVNAVPHRSRRHPEYQNTYTYISEQLRRSDSCLCNCTAQWPSGLRLLAFHAGHLLCTALNLAPALLFHRSFLANTAVLALALLVVLANGLAWYRRRRQKRARVQHGATTGGGGGGGSGGGAGTGAGSGAGANPAVARGVSPAIGAVAGGGLAGDSQGGLAGTKYGGEEQWEGGGNGGSVTSNGVTTAAAAAAASEHTVVVVRESSAGCVPPPPPPAPAARERKQGNDVLPFSAHP